MSPSDVGDSCTGGAESFLQSGGAGVWVRMFKQMPNSGREGACKHFTWKNCPVHLAGQTKGHHEGGEKTLILEAICDPQLWMWCAFFGEPGSLNNMNVLGKGSVVGEIMAQTFDNRTDLHAINGA
jgi:hypothetical protein